MIKGVLFDVGGVLVRTCDQSARGAWEVRLGLKPGGLAELVFDSQLGQAAQLGQATLDDVWAWLATHLGLSQDEMTALRRDFWAGDRLDRKLCDYIRRLRPNYRTAMLSNNWVRDGLAMAQELGIADCFDVFVTSAGLGVMKPDARIYHATLERLEITPPEALFVDDFMENVEAARRLGMQAIHFVDPAQIYRQLEDRLCISGDFKGGSSYGATPRFL
ncbi:MAG: HAD family phosphatase [Anaerolineae bacterium]